MSKNKHMENLYDTADKFINLANILVQEDNSGTVGAGMRFASTRYSVFELSLTRDIAEEKEAIKEELLKVNVYSRHQAEKAKKSKLKVFV
jgi:hypothetical protein